MTKHKAYMEGFLEAIESQASAFSVLKYPVHPGERIVYDFMLHYEIPNEPFGETYLLGLDDYGNPHAKQL